jgi:hypothetical protein
MRTHTLMAIVLTAILISVVHAGPLSSQPLPAPTSGASMPTYSDVVVTSGPSMPVMMVKGMGGGGMHNHHGYRGWQNWGGGVWIDPYGGTYDSSSDQGYVQKCWWNGQQNVCRWVPRSDSNDW